MYKQSLLCLIRKEKYSKNSYIFKPFIPSETISNKIYSDLEYDFEKEHFYYYLSQLDAQSGGRRKRSKRYNKK